MSKWLYERVLERDNDREPEFALQATIGWMDALCYEIEALHGADVESQIRSYRSFFKEQLKPSSSPPNLAPVFEPLFLSITNAMALERVTTELSQFPWARPSAVVTWYYAVYFAARTMFNALGGGVPESHSAACNAFASSLRPKLPHPLNMVAQRTSGEIYTPCLPSVAPCPPAHLSRTFDGKPDTARGMLLEYLAGTARWYADRTKQRILSEKKYPNFRSILARADRDRRLLSEVGFLHCAFRYRTKANYRDAIYLTYGSTEPHTISTFLDHLASTARSITTLAIAFAERRVGPTSTATFLGDVKTNLREITRASTNELFWTGFSA